MLGKVVRKILGWFRPEKPAEKSCFFNKFVDDGTLFPELLNPKRVANNLPIARRHRERVDYCAVAEQYLREHLSDEPQDNEVSVSQLVAHAVEMQTPVVYEPTARPGCCTAKSLSRMHDYARREFNSQLHELFLPDEIRRDASLLPSANVRCLPLFYTQIFKRLGGALPPGRTRLMLGVCFNGNVVVGAY